MKTVKELMRLPYKMEITPDPDEGGYVASYPDLPGCITAGDTMEKTLTNAEDAKKAWLEAAIESNIDINKKRNENCICRIHSLKQV